MEPDRQDRRRDEGLDLWEQARLFGLLNMALADGYVGSFETKYLYNFWRPVTAIQRADTDGNPDTDVDPTWTPLVPTPPIPDHDSAHGVEGGAAAQVFKRFFGTDQISFETCSLTLPAGSTCNDASPVPRSFTSFSQAAEENASPDPRRLPLPERGRGQGVKHGRRIGDRAVDLFMLPVRSARSRASRPDTMRSHRLRAMSVDHDVVRFDRVDPSGHASPR